MTRNSYTEEAERLVVKHASKGALIDTCLLLVLLAGGHSPSLIGNSKLSIDKFSNEDFLFLRNLLKPLHRIVITPQVLAELSNLSGKISGELKKSYYKNIIEYLKPAHEVHVVKDTLLAYPELPRLGFTDISILDFSKTNNFLIITDDRDLYETAIKNNCECIFFLYIQPSFIGK